MKLLSERLACVYQMKPDLEGERGQTGLVRASGASKSVVNQWLTDKIKSMDIRYALNIERELGFSHIWLMTGEGMMTASGVLSEDEEELLGFYRASNERGQAAIRTVARSLAGTAGQAPT